MIAYSGRRVRESPTGDGFQEMFVRIPYEDVFPGARASCPHEGTIASRPLSEKNTTVRPQHLS